MALRRFPVFAFFENLVDPYPAAEPAMPPPTALWPSTWYYTKPGDAPGCSPCSVLTALISCHDRSVDLLRLSSVDWSIWLSTADRRDLPRRSRQDVLRGWRLRRRLRAAGGDPPPVLLVHQTIAGVHRCSSAGRRTATSSARASTSSTTSSPAASRRRSCRPAPPSARR